MSADIKVENETSVSSASSNTTIESPESVKELITEVPLSYKTLVKRLSLKPYTRNITLDLNEPAKPKIFAEIIYHNFVEGHFYGYNAILSRAASDNLRIEDRYNRKVLYRLMGNEEASNFMGFKYCLMIVKEVINVFKVYYIRRKVAGLFESAASDIVDFMEVILNDLTPKYSLDRNDPMYDLEAHCIMEFESLIKVGSIIDASVLNIFNDPDLIKVIVRRYTSIWPASMTGKIITDVARLGNVNLFRDVFSFMVKRVPEYFVHSDQIVRYNICIKSFKNDIFGTMNMMAPIFRAFTLIDSDAVIEDYLQKYYGQLIKPVSGPCFSWSDSSVRALNYFVRDSKFTLINSFEMKKRKRRLLVKILLIFYGISKRIIYNLIHYTLLHDYLPLYEVLLQHFGEDLSTNHKKELIGLIVTSKEIENAIVATSITLGYLEIEDFKRILYDLNPENNQFPLNLHLPKRSHDENFKRQMKRFTFIKETHELLENCPIKGKTGIFVDEGFEAVPWEYPLNIFDEEETDDESESYSKLFYHAQSVLIKYFDISISGVSYFESTMHESVVWSEMIGYMNLMIETQSKLVHGQQNAKLFIFKDSTKYESGL